jgi:hypothetical protein
MKEPLTMEISIKLKETGDKLISETLQTYIDLKEKHVVELQQTLIKSVLGLSEETSKKLKR